MEENPLVMKIEISGCPYRDAETLNVYAHALELFSVLMDMKARVKNRMKHGDIQEDEAFFLESLLSDLVLDDLQL